MGNQMGGSISESKITEENLSSPVENDSKSAPVESEKESSTSDNENVVPAQSDLAGSSSNSNSDFENHSSDQSNNVNESVKVEKKRKRKWRKKKKKRVQNQQSEKFKSNHVSSTSAVSDRILKRSKFWKEKKRVSVEKASVPSFSSFSSFSKKNNLKFSNKHGFGFSFGVKSERPKRPPVWKEKKRDSVDHASVPSFSSFSDFSSFSKNNDLHLSKNHARGFLFGCSKLCSYSFKEMLGFNTGVNSESLKDRMFDPSEYQKLLCESTRFYAKQCFYSSHHFDCGKGVNGTNLKGPIFKWVPKSS